MVSIKKRQRKEIISLNIDLINYQDALSEVTTLGADKRSAYVCFANVHMTIEAYENNLFAQQVNNATLVVADGVPLVKILSFFYGTKQDRIAGMDFLPDLLKAAEINNLKVFFFGTTTDILDKIKVRIEKEFSRLCIAGMYSPPFNKSLDDPSYIEIIKQSEAELVFVALGCPKQEKWMATHSHELPAVLLGVGGAFPVFAGVATRAPSLMRNLGLEWLFRLYQEPTRLFKRYLHTNSLFIYLTLKTKIKMIVNKV